LQYWFKDVTCPQGSLPRQGFYGKGFPADAIGLAQQECEAACDADHECLYAGLHFYYNPAMVHWTHCASCYFYSEHCGVWDNYYRRDHTLYVKAGAPPDRLLANSDKLFISQASTSYFAWVSSLALCGLVVSI